MRLRCKVLGPGLAKATDYFYNAINTVFGLTFFGTALFSDGPENPFWMIWAGHLVFYLVTSAIRFHHWIAKHLFGKRLDFVLSENYLKTGGWIRYTTWINNLLNFTTEIHPKAEREAEEESDIGKRLPKYYRKTVNIVMINGEMEHVLASIYNAPKKVHAIMIRLHEMKAAIDQQTMEI